MVDRIGFSIAATQNVVVSGSPASATALQAQTRQVRLVSTTDCWVAIGLSPTATTSSMMLLASQPEYFQVRQGEGISALQVAAGGTLNIAEMVR